MYSTERERELLVFPYNSVIWSGDQNTSKWQKVLCTWKPIFLLFFFSFGAFRLNTCQNTPINFASSLHVPFPRNSKKAVQVYVKNYVWKSYVLRSVKLFTFSACNSRLHLQHNSPNTGWCTKRHTIDCARNTFLLLQKHLTSGTELILIGWKRRTTSL